MKRMNAAAFYRGEAITRLEARAPTIVEHLALVTWFPNHAATSHWKAELKLFKQHFSAITKERAQSTIIRTNELLML